MVPREKLHGKTHVGANIIDYRIQIFSNLKNSDTGSSISAPDSQFREREGILNCYLIPNIYTPYYACMCVYIERNQIVCSHYNNDYEKFIEKKQ